MEKISELIEEIDIARETLSQDEKAEVLVDLLSLAQSISRDLSFT